MKNILKGYRLIATYLLLMLATLLWLCSCRTQYVPVETVRTERVEVHDTVTIADSTARNDSTATEVKMLLQKVDSAYLAMLGIINAPKEAWLLQTEKTTTQKTTEQKSHEESQKQSSDTVRTEVIEVPYPVERQLSKWEQFCLDYGKVMVGCSVVMVILLLFIIVRWINRRKRKA